MTTRFANLMIDTADGLASAKTSEDAWNVIVKTGQRIGAKAVNGGAFISASRQIAWARSSMERTWLDEYSEAELYRVDPIINGIQRGAIPRYMSAGTPPEHLRDDPATCQMHDGLARLGYHHFITHHWAEGPMEKVLVLGCERDPSHLFGPGTGRALRAVSAMLSTRFHAPQDNNAVEVFGGTAIKLTPTEQDVLSLLAHGLSHEQLARRLNLDMEAVQMTLREICRKMGTPSSEQALALAMARELLSL